MPENVFQLNQTFSRQRYYTVSDSIYPISSTLRLIRETRTMFLIQELVLILGTAYPIYRSYLSIKHSDHNEQLLCLCYWVLYVLWMVVVDTVILATLLPAIQLETLAFIFQWAKLVLVIYLMVLPAVHGASSGSVPRPMRLFRMVWSQVEMVISEWSPAASIRKPNENE